MSIMNEEIALYQSGARSGAPWATLKVGDYFQWIKTGVIPQKINQCGDRWQIKQGYQVMQDSAHTINGIRKGIPPREKDVLKNQHLTPVTFGHCNPVGKETGVVVTRVIGKKNDSGTRFVCFDIDGIETTEQAQQQRDRLFLSIPSVLAAGLSASGKGVWLVIALSRQTANKDDYANVWWLLAAELKEKGVDIGQSTGAGATDRAPSNMVSLRYYSYDPDMKVRGNDIEVYQVPDPDEVPTIEESKVRAGVLHTRQTQIQRNKSTRPTVSPNAVETRDTSKQVSRGIPPVPIYSERVNWVAQANDGGVDNHHDRARNAIWKDVMEGQIPDDNRIDAYVSAIGREDRAEVVRLVDGAVEKISTKRQAKARGETNKTSGIFTNPKTMPDTMSEFDLSYFAGKVLPTNKVLYVPELKIWRIWDDNAWRDGTLELTSWMGAVGRNTYGYMKETKGGGQVFKKQPSTGGRISTAKNAISFMRSTLREKSVVHWDDNRRVLGLPNGDCLEIGSNGAIVRRQVYSDYITQTLPFAPADDWRGGEFESFLNRVVPDEETRLYLQRHLGYGLVCDGSEPYFLWLRGQGRSGKSTLIRYVQSCVPQHFAAVERDTLLLKLSSRHSTREAKLANKRFGYWAEARGDGKIDAEKIKGWTGGDEQTSHFMRQDMFDWTPRFLLIVVSNSDLQLNSPDEAFYERVRLIDCWTTIPAKERKTSVWRLARSGDPQCLRWLADGAADYITAVESSEGSGLLPETNKMLQDRLDWQYNADPISKFVKQRCEIVHNPTAGIHTIVLNIIYPKYCQWHEGLCYQGELDGDPINKTEFSRRLKQIPGVIYKERRLVNSNVRERGFNLVMKDE